MKKLNSNTNMVLKHPGANDFETFETATVRQQVMIRQFDRSGIEHNLGECGPSGCQHDPCVEACHFATVHRRDAARKTGLPLLQCHSGPHYQVCIVHPLWEADAGALSTIRMAAAKQWLYRRLGQSTRHIRAVGIFEASLNVELNKSRYWAGELQIICCGLERNELKKLLRIESRYRTIRPRQRMLQIVDVGNLERQFMYAQKRFVERRIAYICKNGRQHRRHLPLNAKDQLEFDGWLNKLSSGGRNVCFGLSRRGHTFYLPDATSWGGADDN